MPIPPVALDCGSQSISSVDRPSSASAAARLIAVVVLPTPPFWLTTAMTLAGLALVWLESVLEGAERVDTFVVGSLSGMGFAGKEQGLCRSEERRARKK